MTQKFSVKEKVYQNNDGVKFSIFDMLGHFYKMGVMRVSDLHLKVNTPPAYRVDGDLVKMKGPKLDNETARKLIYPLLSEKQIKDFENDHNVDASYQVGQLQFRINVFMDNDGISAAVRGLSNEVPEVESIGFPNDVWKDIIRRKQGLVLMTGITGAGKSTTIASLIARISQQRACRIITLEDPIEYILGQKKAMISQREVGRDVPKFIDGLKAMLREDPDIVFVGEMRDQETISMTLMAAETGHLVFSTLHTRDVIGTLTRILDYFPAERHDEVSNQLSLGLAYVVSQKLIPKKGGDGRIVAMEILNNSYACRNLIRTGKIEQLYSQLQTKTKDRPDEKMITMEACLARMVKRNEIDLLEAQKWANDHKAFIDAMEVEIVDDED